MDKLTERRTVEWTNGQADVHSNGRTDRWPKTGGEMDGQTDGQMNGQTDARTEVHTDTPMNGR